MPDDLLRFNPNGTISCTVGETRYTLRKVKAGELRDLWSAWEQVAIEADAAVDPHRERLAELQQRASDPDLSSEIRQEARAQRQQLNAKLRREKHDLFSRWIRRVFTTLADAPLPDDDDDLEPWMLDLNTGAEFVNHWTSRPKASGS